MASRRAPQQSESCRPSGLVGPRFSLEAMGDRPLYSGCATGLIEGRSVAIEYRWAKERRTRYEIATEFIRSRSMSLSRQEAYSSEQSE